MTANRKNKNRGRIATLFMCSPAQPYNLRHFTGLRVKRKMFWVPWVAANIFLLVSCMVPYSLVTERHVVSPENFAVDLPQGWRQHDASFDPDGAIWSIPGVTAMLEKRRKVSWDVIRLTHDGLLLQQICIGRMPVVDELPNTKREIVEEWPRWRPLK